MNIDERESRVEVIGDSAAGASKRQRLASTDGSEPPGKSLDSSEDWQAIDSSSAPVSQEPIVLTAHRPKVFDYSIEYRRMYTHFHDPLVLDFATGELFVYFPFAANRKVQFDLHLAIPTDIAPVIEEGKRLPLLECRFMADRIHYPENANQPKMPLERFGDLPETKPEFGTMMQGIHITPSFLHSGYPKCNAVLWVRASAHYNVDRPWVFYDCNIIRS